MGLYTPHDVWAGEPVAGGAQIRGVVRAVEQALISTDLAVRAAAIHVREGDAFKTGDKLVEFDCRRQKATIAAAEAQQHEMQLTVDRNGLLLKTQSVGKSDVDVAEVRLAKAKAEADALRSQLDQCVVVAPFDGRVLDLSLQRHETSQPGKPFISLVANGRLEIDLIVPSLWIGRLTHERAFVFFIDELGREVAAKIARVGAAVDPVSQTIKVICTLDNADGTVLPGMSGTVRSPGLGE